MNHPSKFRLIPYSRISLLITQCLPAAPTYLAITLTQDMSDLFGCDLPSEDGSGFCWRDGPLLKALKNGNWVLLDEMNLASQAVLEGLI